MICSNADNTLDRATTRAIMATATLTTHAQATQSTKWFVKALSVPTRAMGLRRSSTKSLRRGAMMRSVFTRLRAFTTVRISTNSLVLFGVHGKY